MFAFVLLTLTVTIPPNTLANSFKLVAFDAPDALSSNLTSNLASNSAGDLFITRSTTSGDSIISLSQPPVLLLDAKIRLQEDTTQLENSRAPGSVLASYGDPIGDKSEQLGQLLSVLGEPLDLPLNTDKATSHVFMPASGGGNLYTVWNRDTSHADPSVHIGLSGISRLALKHGDAGWQLDSESSSMLPTNQVDGVFNVTAATSTAWETVLFNESIPPELTAIWNHPDVEATDNAERDPAFAAIASANTLIERESNPYRYGYLVELRTPNGDSRISDDGILASGIVRHYASGRMQSDENVVVTDASTLYRISSESGQLFRFIADYPNNLSSGELSVAKYDSDYSARETSGFNIRWIQLGHGSNEEIDAWIGTYEGMSSYDYTEGSTSYITEEEIQSWAESHSGRDLDDNGSIDQYIDSRVAFLEPVKAAAALGITAGDINIKGLASDGASLLLSVQTDDPTCNTVYQGMLDTNGNVSRIQPTETSLCNQQLALDQRSLFLHEPGVLFTTGAAGLHRLQLQ